MSKWLSLTKSCLCGLISAPPLPGAASTRAQLSETLCRHQNLSAPGLHHSWKPVTWSLTLPVGLHCPSAQPPLPAPCHTGRAIYSRQSNPFVSSCAGLGGLSSVTPRREARVTRGGGDTCSVNGRDSERDCDSWQPQKWKDPCWGTLRCHARGAALLWWVPQNPGRGQRRPARRSAQHPSGI